MDWLTLERTTDMHNILIRSRLGEFSGLANDTVAIFDCFDPEAGRMVRHFVLLQEAVKLMFEPWDWKDRWYVDLVGIKWVDENTLELKDLYIDIIVEGNGPTYRIIDMEEFADALKNQKISADAIHEPLHRLQQFLDNHLHGGKDFPPAIILPFL